MHHLTLIALCAVVFLPGLARAQDPSPQPFISAEGLPKVFVLDRQGGEYTGKLLRIDAAELVVLVGHEERRFPRETVVRVHKRGDSLKNGTVIGAVAGTVMGILAAGISDCPGFAQDSCPGARIGVMLVSVGLYTAVGAGIDAAVQGRTLIYDASRAAPAAQRGRRAALGFTLRW